jgi:hypothetical protein
MTTVESRIHEALTSLLEMAGKYDALRHQVMAWKETAEQNQRNADFYRGLVVEIGQMLGEDAYLQDDGGRSEDVLCAKVPELVRRVMSSQRHNVAEKG